MTPPNENSFRLIIVKVTIPRIGYEPDFFALIQGTNGECDIKTTILPNAPLIRELAGREFTYYSAYLQDDGGFRFGWECSPWIPPIKSDDSLDSFRFVLEGFRATG